MDIQKIDYFLNVSVKLNAEGKGMHFHLDEFTDFTASGNLLEKAFEIFNTVIAYKNEKYGDGYFLVLAIALEEYEGEAPEIQNVSDILDNASFTPPSIELYKNDDEFRQVIKNDTRLNIQIDNGIHLCYMKSLNDKDWIYRFLYLREGE